MIRIILGLATLAVLGLSVVLISDASTFLLQRANPARGHLVRGCYTLLDDLLRTPQPNGVLRVIELVSPLVLLPITFGLNSVRRRLTRD